MSFVYDPADKDLLIKDARYYSRALWFSWSALILSVAGLVFPFILPIGLVFTYLAYRNSVQATQEGFRYNQFWPLRMISLAPFVAIVGIALYWIGVLTNGTSGWASLGVLIMGLIALPFAFIASIIGFFTTRSLRRKDGIVEPRNIYLLLFRILGYLSFAAACFFIVMGGLGILGSFF